MSKSKTILFAETDIIVRSNIARHLRSCGYKVFEASSAEEAESILNIGSPLDILLVDARLAGRVNGFALAQRARIYHREIEIHLIGSLTHKIEAALRLCGGDGDRRQMLQSLQARRAASVKSQSAALKRPGPHRAK